MGGHLFEILAIANRHQINRDIPLGVRGYVTWGDAAFIFQVSRKINRGPLLDDDPVFHLPERGFNEAILVNPGVGRQGANQAGVWTFRGLDGANPSVMGRMDIANGKSRPFPGQAPRTEGTDATFVGEFRQGIRLIHELAELAGAKELLNRRHQGFGIDQLSWSKRIGFAYSHALLDDPFEAIQANTNLVLKQFANGSHPTVTKMVNIIKGSSTNIELKIYQIIDGGEHILRREGTNGIGYCKTEFFINFVTPNPTEIVPFRIEETAMKQLLTTTYRGGFAWA